MKKLLFLVTILNIIVTFSYAQLPELRLTPTVQSVNSRGQQIVKGDTIVLDLQLKPNGTAVRSFYLDFQHQITAINLIDVVFPTTGSAIPQGGTATFQNNYYPGYTFARNANNTTTDGLTNFNNAYYNYTQGGNKAINRIWINTASANNLVDGTVGQLRFKVTNIDAGFAYDSVYFNAAYAYTANYGQQLSVFMPKPTGSWVTPIPSSNALINGKVDMGKIVPTIYIVDTLTSVVKAQVVPSNTGEFFLGPELATNTWYRAFAVVPSDSLAGHLNKAITVSDYTAAQNEFIKQNLNGTFSLTTMKSGASFLAADVNQNYRFDGGDLTALFAQVSLVDTIIRPTAGQSVYTIPMFAASQFDTLTPAHWQTVNKYGVLFKTSTTAQDLKLKYLIPGDINRSHSSQVVLPDNTIQSFSIKSTAVNHPKKAGVVDVNLNNLTVTANEFTIPVNIDTKGDTLSGLQFEFVYDPNKVKFESIKTDMPTWLVFVNIGPGKVKFGAVDRELKTGYTGGTPFKLVFSTLQNGLDINSAIKVTDNMDASNMQGTQLGLNLNSTTIKLTGYNNF